MAKPLAGEVRPAGVRDGVIVWAEEGDVPETRGAGARDVDGGSRGADDGGEGSAAVNVDRGDSRGGEVNGGDAGDG